MNPIHAAALEIQAFARGRSWQFCIIGALAVERWGEPRLTHDVDLTILTGFARRTRYNPDRWDRAGLAKRKEAWVQRSTNAVAKS